MIIERVIFDIPPGDVDMLDGHHASDFVLKSGDTMGTLETGFLEAVSAKAADAIIITKVSPPAIKTSLDGGKKWATVVNNGDPVTDLNGSDASGRSLMVKQEFTTTDVTQTPVLKSCSVDMKGSSTVSLSELYGSEFLSSTIVTTTFARAGPAHKGDRVTQVAADVPRFESSGVTVEEATTNLILNSAFTADDNADGVGNDWNAYNPGPHTAMYRIVTWDGGRKAQEVTVPEGTTENAGIYQSVTLSPSTTYTLSFDVCYTKDANFYSQWKPYLPNYHWVGDTNIMATTKPYRHTVTFTTTEAGETEFYIRNVGDYPTTTEGIQFSNVQIEAKPYATSWTDGTRAAESLKVTAPTVINTSEGTIELVANITAATLDNAGGTMSRQIFVTRDGSAHNRIASYFLNSDDNLHFILTDNSGNDTDMTCPKADVTAGSHRFAYRWSKDEAAMFIDGVKVASAANPYLPITTNDYVWIGVGIDGSGNWLDGQISDFVASNAWRSDVELENRGYPDPLLPDSSTTCILRFTSDLSNASGNILNNVDVPRIIRTWDDNLVANQTLFGASGVYQYASGGQFHLQGMPSTDAKSRFDDMPAVADFVAQFDIQVPSSASYQDCGLMYRCTYWGDANDTGGYYAYATNAGSVRLGHGSNSSAPAFSSLYVTADNTLTPGKWYTLKVIVNGTRHIVQVNGVTYIDYNDRFYTGAGQFAFRCYNNSQTCNLDNLSIYAGGLQLARQGTDVVDSRYTNGDFAGSALPPTFNAGCGSSYNSDGTPARAVAWNDAFSADSIGQYDSGGMGIGTWTVSGGNLQCTSANGAQCWLVKSGLILTDCEIEATFNSAEDAGLILRLVDNDNYYMVAVRDDTGGSNLDLYTRINGVFSLKTQYDVTWARGTDVTVKFRVVGSTLAVYFNGSSTPAITYTDSTLLAGRAGFRSDGGAFIVKDVAINDLSKQAARFESRAAAGAPTFARDGTALKNGGASVAANAPRFEAAGMTIEEATTNYYAGSTPNTSTADCSDVTGVGPIPTAKAWKGTFSAAEQYFGWEAQFGLPALIVGDKISISGYYKVEAGCPCTQMALVAWKPDWSAYCTDVQFVPLVADGQWHYYTDTLTVSIGCTNPHIQPYFIQIPTDWVGNAYVCGLQIEKKAFSTTYAGDGGSRSVESLYIPTANTISLTQGTIEQVINVNESTLLGQHYLWSTSTAPNGNQANTLSLEFTYSSGTPYLFMYTTDASGNAWSSDWYDVSGLSHGLHRIAASWDSSHAIKIFIDGTPVTQVTATYWPSTLAASLYIGSWANPNYASLDTQTYDFIISNRARSPTELGTRAVVTLLGADGSATYYLPLTASIDLAYPTSATGGLVIEEATVNLAPNPNFATDVNNAGGWQSTVAWDNTEGYSGGTCAKFTLTSTMGTMSESIALTSPVVSTPYTASCWIKGTAGKSCRLYTRMSGGANAYTEAGQSVVTCTGDWQYFAVTQAVDYTDRTSFGALIYGGGQSGDVFKVDCLQIEQKAYATSFTDSKRAAEVLFAPVVNALSATQGTVEMVVNVNSAIKETSTAHEIFSCTNSGVNANRLSAGHTTSNGWELVMGDGSGTLSILSTPDTLLPGPHRFAFRWSATEAALFIDGAKVATADNPHFMAALSPAAYIGSYYDKYYFANTWIGDVVFSSIWRDDSSLMERSIVTALGVDDYTTYYMPLTSAVENTAAPRADGMKSNRYFGATASYNFYKTHAINGSADGNLSGYQVKFDVYSGAGTDANGSVYLNNHSLSWPNDIRFTSASGALLDYWIESVDSAHAVVWVEVDRIPTTGATIYLWYGKANDTSASDGVSTFPMLFDHFDGSSVNTNTWTVANTGSSTATTSTSLLTINNNGSGTGSVYTKVAYDAGYAFRGRVRMGVAQSYFQWCTASDNDEHWFETLDGTTLQYRSAVGGGNIVRAAVPGVTFSASTYYNFEIQRPVGYGVKYLVDDSLKVTYPYTSSGQTISARIASWNNTGVTYVDWCLLRKITINEPAHAASWGAEAANARALYSYRKLHQITGSSTGTTDYQMLFDIIPGTGIDGTLPLSEFNAGQWTKNGGDIAATFRSVSVDVASGINYSIDHLVTGLVAGQTYTIYAHTTAASGTPSVNIYSGTPGNVNATLVMGGSMPAANIGLGDNTWTVTVQSGHTSLHIYLWGYSNYSAAAGSMTIDKVTINNIPNVVYLNNHCLSWPNDIRFTTEDGLTQMDYWVEAYPYDTYCGTHMLVWVKIPSIPANSTTNMYIYYGRADDVSMSNGDRTFQFFDDFDAPAATVNMLTHNQSNGAEDGTTTVFTYYNSTMSRDTSVYYAGASSMKWTVATAGQQGSIRTSPAKAKVHPSVPYTASCYAKSSQATATLKMYIWYWDAAGNVITNTGGHSTTVNSSTWTRCTTTSYPPPYAVYADVEIYGVAIANGDAFWADNLQLEQGTTATTWVPGGVLGLGSTNILPASMADCESYTAGFPAAFTGYSYRKSHTVTSSEALTSFQVKLTLHRTGTSDSGADVYLNGHSATWNGTANTLADIRFGNNAGTSLDYWIESDDGNTAYVWVEIDTLSTSGTIIWVYYGKTSDTNASSGANTFVFFDDFSTINNWTASYQVMENSGPFATLNTGYNTPSVSGNNLTLGGTRSSTDAAYEDGVNSGWWGRSVRTTAGISLDSFVVGTRAYYTQSSSGTYVNQYNMFEVGVGYDKNNYLYGKWNSGGWVSIGREIGGTGGNSGANALSLSASTNYNAELRFVNNGTCTFTLNGTSAPTYASASLTTKYVTLGFDHRAPSAVVSEVFDWLYVRKYTATEPTHGTWGSEQLSTSINTTELETSGYCSITPVTTAYHGSKGIGIVSMAGQTTQDNWATLVVPTTMTLSPSTWYSWQARVYAPTTVYYHTNYVYLQEWGGSWRTPGSMAFWVDGVSTGTGLITLTTGWHLISGIGLTAADWQTGSVPFRFVFRPARNSADNAYDATNTICFDCFQLERNNTPSNWVPGTYAGLDPAKWNTVDGTGIVIQDGLLQHGNTSAKAVSNATFGPGYTVEAKTWTYSIPTNGYTPVGLMTSDTTGISFLNHPGNAYYRNNATWVNIGGTETPKYVNLLYRIDMAAYTTHLRMSYYNTDVTFWDVSPTCTVGAYPIFFGQRQGEASQYMNQSFSAVLDWIRVRKYLPAEPTHGATGGEDAAGDGRFVRLETSGANYSRSFSTSAELGTGLVSGLSLSTGYPKTSGVVTGTWTPPADDISQVGVARSSYIAWDCSSLVPNSGFDSVTNGVIDSWGTFANGFPDTSRVSITPSSTVTRTGSGYSAHFVCDSYPSGGGWGLVQTNVYGVRAGESHVISAYIKGRVDGWAVFSIDYMNSSNASVGWVNYYWPSTAAATNYTDWTLLEFVAAAAPAGAVYARPHIYLCCNADFYIDDYRFYPKNQVTVQTSLDGGSSWATCINHSQIPNVQPGTNCRGKSLLMKVTLKSDDAMSYPPSLYSIGLNIYPQYRAGGSWISTPVPISAVATGRSSTVNWTGAIPAVAALPGYLSTDAGTSFVAAGRSGTLTAPTMTVYTSLDGTTWSAVANNGGAVAGLAAPFDCSGKEVYLKVAMSGDGSGTPMLSALTTAVRSAYKESGYRISRPVDLSPLGVVASSSASWVSSPPAAHISIGGPSKSDLYINENISAANLVDSADNPSWSVQLRTSDDQFSIRRTGYWYDDFNDDSLSPAYTKIKSSTNVWLERGGVLTANCWYTEAAYPAGLQINNMTYADEDMEIVAKLMISRPPMDIDGWWRVGLALKTNSLGQGYNFIMYGTNTVSQLRFGHDYVGWYASTDYTFSANVWYWMKFRVTGASGHRYLYGKIWLDGTTEPAAWTISQSDEQNTTYQGTQPMLMVPAYGNKGMTVKFDSVSVNRVGTTAGDLLSVSNTGLLTTTGGSTTVAPGGIRTAAVLVAASDASQAVKNGADYVCDGTNDEAEINAAISSLPTGYHSCNIFTANQSSVETDVACFGGYQSPTRTRDTSKHLYGAASVKWVITIASQSSLTTASSSTYYTAAQEYLPYTASVYVMCAASNTCKSIYSKIQCFNSAGGYIGAAGDASTTVNDTGWTRVVSTGTMPAGTATMYFELYTSGTPAVDDTFWSDGFQFELGNTASPWVLGGTTASASGGTVILSEGNFTVGSKINLSKGSVTLSGNSMGGTTIKMANSFTGSTGMINATKANYVTVSNLVLDGNKANQSSGTGGLIHMDGVTHLTVRNIEGKNAYSDAVYIAGRCADVYVQNVNGHDCNGCSVSVPAATDFIVSSCSGYSNGSSGGGFYAASAYRGIYTNCTSNNNTYSGIYLDTTVANIIVNGCGCDANGTDGITCRGTICSMVNNTCNNNIHYGIYCDTGGYNLMRGNTTSSNHMSGICGVGGGTLKGYSITGNTAYNNTNYGITVSGLSETLVYGNAVYFNGYHGIYLCSTSTCSSVASNMCFQNSQGTHNTYSNICLDASSNNLVYGNKCFRGDSGNMPSVGIALGAGSNTNVVFGNDLLYGGGVATYDGGTGNIWGTSSSTNINRM